MTEAERSPVGEQGGAWGPVLAALSLDPTAGPEQAVGAIEQLRAMAHGAVDAIEAGDAVLDTLREGVALAQRLSGQHEDGGGDSAGALVTLGKLNAWAEREGQGERAMMRAMATVVAAMTLGCPTPQHPDRHHDNAHEGESG